MAGHLTGANVTFYSSSGFRKDFVCERRWKWAGGSASHSHGDGLLTLAGIQWTEDTVPTVAFHFRKVRRGNVTLKIWDLAGQPR